MMKNVITNIKLNKFWKKINGKNCEIYLKGYIYSYNENDLIKIIENIEKKDIEAFIKSIDGHFALIIKKDNFSFIAVDKIRSTPLFFITINNQFYIDYDPKNLVNRKGFKKEIRNDSILEIAMSGYTLDNKTIYKNLYSLKAGELVIFENNEFEYKQYYKYFGEIEDKPYNYYIEELSETTLNIFKKLISQLNGRQIVIPLSAGNDSRLVASVLKHLGYDNVKLYSYGTPGNFEAKIAKKIAKKLGYEWIFIPLTHRSEKKYYSSTDYKEFLNYAETFCSVPYIQGLSTIKYLQYLNYIETDAIFINGNTGDFISGAHINALMKDHNPNMSFIQRKENILNHLIKKHFSLWGYLKTEENLKKIKKNLWNEIKNGCDELNEYKKDHLFYEYSEFIDRQTKYVNLAEMGYEFYGFEWRLPLWDDEYLYFWQKIPVEYKINQKLYVDMLKKQNWGGVWDDSIPVNKKTITPKWIIPFRFLAKIPFGVFGKKGKEWWHYFENSIFYYWMDVSHMIDSVSYFRMIKDVTKKPRHHVSWQSEDYLKKYVK